MSPTSCSLYATTDPTTVRMIMNTPRTINPDDKPTFISNPVPLTFFNSCSTTDPRMISNIPRI
jgi:hypothetical protein